MRSIWFSCSIFMASKALLQAAIKFRYGTLLMLSAISCSAKGSSSTAMQFMFILKIFLGVPYTIPLNPQYVVDVFLDIADPIAFLHSSDQYPKSYLLQFPCLHIYFSLRNQVHYLLLSD